MDGPTLRAEFGIPVDALVLGRHGGYDTFDLEFVREVIGALAKSGANVFFLLMNAPPRLARALPREVVRQSNMRGR